MFLFVNYVISFLIFIFSSTALTTTGFTTTKIGPRPLWNATFTDKLRQDLLLNYDKFARPAHHLNKTTVTFGVILRHIELNEFKSTVTLYSYVKMNWNDEKLKWNPSDYGNLSTIHLADHEIWQPDLFLYNSGVAAPVNHFGNTHAIVSSKGEVLLAPPAQFTALCEFNLHLWPFDTQTCVFVFGSWTYHGYQIDLQLLDNHTNFDPNLLMQNAEWKIKKVLAKHSLKYYSCCEEPYGEIQLSITVDRISPSYRAIIITPAFAIILLTLMNFWLPPQAGEKIILQGCSAIIISLFLLYFTQKLPAMGANTPLIVLFYSTSLSIVCFCMLGSVTVIWLSRTNHCYSLPWILKQPLVGWLGRWLGLGNYISQTPINTHRVNADEMRDHQVSELEEHNTNDDHQMIGNCNKNASQQEWILFAAAIDRISFIFYTLLFTILAIAYAL